MAGYVSPCPWYICIILSSWADVKTDSLFYLLFQLAPPLFFDLIGAPGQGQGYRFESVEVKEAAFRIDGVFLPPEGATDQPVYFVEVQFQRDRQIYRRLAAEIFLFLQKHPQINRWRSVVIFPRASLEPDDALAYSLLLNSDYCQRVYLDQLPDHPSVSLGLVQLMVTPANQAAERARQLMSQATASPPPILDLNRIIELVETILVYKFPQQSREELTAMLGISALKQTRVFQEFYEDGQRDGLEQGLERGRQEGLEAGRQEGLEEGRQRESLALVQRQLRRRLGDLPEVWRDRLATLGLGPLEELAEALLDFQSLADLQDWWQLWQEQQGQVLAALVEHLGQPLDSWDPSLVNQVQRLGRQELTTLQEDLPGLNSLEDLAAWCEQAKQRP
jgi:predicted transposase/invertase (TIGR01784 family)